MNDKQIFDIKTSEEFEKTGLQLFKYQAKHNPVYKTYLNALSVDATKINDLRSIPFLPISMFKTQQVITGNKPPVLQFASSGTGGAQSFHHLTDVEIYKQSFRKGFEQFFGNIKNTIILALLPGYLERKNSSLVYMVNDLIKGTESELSGFYLDDYEQLYTKLREAYLGKKQVLLLGVSHALLDFFELYNVRMPELTIMETGGMKGRRKELIREDLHKQLSNASGTQNIVSEYGMTELLSQAYYTTSKRFVPVPWMKVFSGDLYDPFSYTAYGQTGGLKIIDLANANSCAFIETKDIGKVYSDGSFEVLGRFDNSDIRGCNLMVV
ncbi:MAG: acyl transferase [Bacteroidota bacterium]|nr:acyl transferase [Bacteroidota bacterium]